MIDSLDIILKRLFSEAVAEVLADSGTRPGDPALDVTFGAPDGTHLDPGAGAILNVFLADVRENRALRTGDRVRLGGGVVEAQAPLRLDCHYLVSAWSRDISDDEAHVAETHRLLYSAASALLRHNPLVARDLFNVPTPFDDEVDAFVAANPGTPPPFLAGQADLEDFFRLDPILRDWEIPLDTLPPEGFHRLADFWGLMGDNPRWRPVAYFVATIPVERSRSVVGPPVRSIGATFAPTDRPGSPGETFFEIGGVVSRVRPGGTIVPAPFVTVELSYERTEPPDPDRDQPGRLRSRVERATTDARGRYTFARVEAGPVRIAQLGLDPLEADKPRFVPPRAIDEYDFLL